MWDALWTDARLATMAPGAPYGAIEGGAIAVRDGKIAWLGPMRELPGDAREHSRKVVAAEGRWVTPGLIDCHTHLVFGGDRSRDFEMRNAGATRAEIVGAGGGIYNTVSSTRNASEAELTTRTDRRLRMLTAEGVTTVEMKSGYGLDLDNELKILRVARALGRDRPVTVKSTFGVYAVAPEFDGRADDYVGWVSDVALPRVAGEGLVDALDVQVDELGFSFAQTVRMFAAARRLGLGFKVHTDELSDFSGSAFAAGHGALSADHLDYLSEEGAAALRRSGTVAVLLPANTFVLGRTQLPPIERLRRHGVPMALATNCNPGPSPTTSLLLMLNMGCTLFKLTAEEALAGVTRNAALALGMGSTHGTLETGKAADFVLWDIERLAELAYYLGYNPCHRVVRGGVEVGPRS